MKKIRTIILLFSGVFLTLPVFARFSCEDLDDMAASLDDLAYEFQHVSDRDIDRRTDRALRDLVDALNMVADLEGDHRLTTWIHNLEIAWEDMDKEDFEDALDDIIDRMDEMYERDCMRRR